MTWRHGFTEIEAPSVIARFVRRCVNVNWRQIGLNDTKPGFTL